MKICPTCKSQYEGGEVFCPVDAARLVTGSQMDSDPGHAGDPFIGATVDRYRVLRRIGEGGMGVVYEAIHTVIEKRVAIKLLRKDFSSRPDVVERFRQEAKSASRIGHEHIVDISDFGETPQGDSYFVMEFLEGHDLANLLGADGVLPLRRALEIVVQCCRALGAAHAKGIVHRDMKPENVFLIRRDGNPDFVKIVDFGIAKMNEIETPGEPGRKLTKTGMIFGTPEYMSPEQAAGKAVDHRVDIYAVGVILFELLLGRVPFVGDSFMGILTQHMFEPIPPFGEVNGTVVVPTDVEAIILKALAKKPEERFQSMEQFADALNGVVQGRPVDPEILAASRPLVASKTEGRALTGLRVDESDSDPKVARRTTGERLVPQRNKGLVVAIAAVAVLAVVGIGYAAFSGGDDSEATGVDAGAAVVAAPAIDAGQPEVDAGFDAGQPAIDAGPSTVALLVETRPTGAEVVVDGTETRCEPSPCTIDATPGVTITLRAESGRASGQLEITPTQAMAVVIPLESSGRGGRSTNTTSTGRTSTMTGMSGDLRIPDIFR